MLDIMYEIPNRTDVEKCVITKETIENDGEPTLVLSQEKKSRARKKGNKESAS
jgi:ATP-dependent Clp protease ATP-binding subunit ClpX